MSVLPKPINLEGRSQFRIIPSVYPTINFFEDLVDPDEMEILWEIEGLTNERLRQETGDIFLVPAHDRVSGCGSSVVMAAFTHIGYASRFTDGRFGIYYASLTYETAIKETVYHRELFLKATRQEAMEITMRSYEGHIIKPLHDIRGPLFHHCHHREDYTASQKLGSRLKKSASWGLIYKSVRDKGGECIAAFRPPAISIPKPISHLRYVWDGKKIIEVFDTKLLVRF